MFARNFCLFKGTGKTVTGVHIAHLFTKLNMQLLSQETSSHNTDTESAKAPPQVIYCGPSNKSVDVVACKCKLKKVVNDGVPFKCHGTVNPQNLTATPKNPTVQPGQVANITHRRTTYNN